ncbi:hypothetical protein QF019_000338 [Pseudomonas frederiksbergensis]|uniref:hypothetical protein n=1 Tax=Pseudomonas frederiksbergensis TaxID=104087 RepID=UPI003D1B601F
MTIDNVIMTLNRIPEIKATIDTGTDWKILGGFVLTALAVALGSFVTAFTFKRTVKSQEKLARAVAIKDSRQAWINELREACADYIAAIGMLQYQADNKSVYQVFIDKVTREDASKAAELVASWELDKRRTKQSALALKAKIEMLSNPNEADFQNLIHLVGEAISRSEKVDGGSKETCEGIVSRSQIILKSEWNRAKNME